MVNQASAALGPQVVAIASDRDDVAVMKQPIQDGGGDTTIVQGLGRAFYWQHLLDTGVMESGSEIARHECLHHSTVNELLRLREIGRYCARKPPPTAHGEQEANARERAPTLAFRAKKARLIRVGL